MAWNFTEISSIRDNPENNSLNLLDVKFNYEADETEKTVTFSLPKNATQEDIQTAIGSFLVGQLNLFTKITKDDINVGYTAILKMIAGIDSLTASLQGRKERALENIVALEEQMNLLLAQKETLDRIVAYLQARAT